MRNIALRTLAGAALFLGCALAARAYTPETTPRPGEQRFNHFQYKASHNSYLRAQPLNVLVDDYNTWEVELDLYWFNNKGDESTLRVAHALPTVGSRTMADYLRELMRSSTWNRRVTFVDLSMKNTLAYPWPAQDVYRKLIMDELNAILGADNIYRFSEFRDTDKYKWPSQQELMRRGYHFAVILDDIDRSDSPDFFEFHFTKDMKETLFVVPNRLVYNTSDPTSVPTGMGDIFLARAWQDEVTLCPWFWQTALVSGYNFVALNCVTDPDAMNEPRFHSPQPLFVNAAGTNQNQYGTFNFPGLGSAGLNAALQRASPMVDVSVQAGSYTIPTTTINRPLHLEARDGPVHIQ